MDKTQMTMTTNRSTIRTPEHVTVADLGGEAVLLDSRSGEYYGVNEVGARILELAQQPATIDAVLTDIVAAYDVDESRLRSDALAFIDEMAKRRLITINE